MNRLNRPVIIDTEEARRGVRDGLIANKWGPHEFPHDEDVILDALGWGDLRDSRERAVQIAVELEGDNAMLLGLLDLACQMLTTTEAYDPGPLLREAAAFGIVYGPLS